MRRSITRAANTATDAPHNAITPRSNAHAELVNAYSLMVRWTAEMPEVGGSRWSAANTTDVTATPPSARPLRVRMTGDRWPPVTNGCSDRTGRLVTSPAIGSPFSFGPIGPRGATTCVT